MKLENRDELIGKTVTIVYKNWRGVIEERKVTVLEFFDGSTPYHKEFQTFMKAWCHERRSERDFAVNDIEKMEE